MSLKTHFIILKCIFIKHKNILDIGGLRVSILPSDLKYASQRIVQNLYVAAELKLRV